MVFGEFVQPSMIYELYIFQSEELYEKLVLPNGKFANEEENIGYILKCFGSRKVEGVGACAYDFITSPPLEKEKPTELTVSLMNSANFLGLDTNWSVATCALQLQEVAVTLVAKRKKIRLDKANVERELNNQYEAFSKLVNVTFDIEMPILTTHLRKMRTKVLHEGYNPKPEETDSIARFTFGLLQKLNSISQTT